MKKHLRIGLLAIASITMLASCGSTESATTVESTTVVQSEATVESSVESNAETTIETTETHVPVEKTVSASATLTWHNTETFMAIVDVKLSDNVIVSVTVRDSSYVTTDAFDLWEPNKADYLDQYVGCTVEEILALEVNDPEDPSNHNDGGKVSGCIDVVAGASASSTVIAKAVKAACQKAAK